MEVLMIRAVRADAGWTLVGDGEDREVAARFVYELAAVGGRSSYTQRSYAMGLACFLRWLASTKKTLAEVSQKVIVAYTRTLTEPGRRPLSAASINHRLSVLASFFGWLLREEEERSGAPPRENPVPGTPDRPVHTVAGRDAPPRRRRAELRRRVPIAVPRGIEPETASKLVEAATAMRDKAILTLLLRTGARIGDWISEADRHGILGLARADVEEGSRLIRVRLKGARDEHRVPVTDDFWPLWQKYLAEERGGDGGLWAWTGRRRGRGKPLRYEAFAMLLRGMAKRLGIQVHAHMFRHGLAEAVIAVSGVAVAQQILGHRHLGTTAEFYARVDEVSMVRGIQAAARLASAARVEPAAVRWAFDYDNFTHEELDKLADGADAGGSR
jgi:site-specific recombinase XerD